MKKSYGILAAAALAVGGMTFVGCHNNNPDTEPTASVGGVGGGGSTDTYGTGSDARMRSTGNIGVDSGGTASNNGVTPQPAAVNERPTNVQPPQTPVSPAGGTGVTGGGINAGSGPTDNTPRTDTRTETSPNATPSNNGNTNTGNNNSGAVLGGTNGNGTTNSGANVPPASR